LIGESLFIPQKQKGEKMRLDKGRLLVTLQFLLLFLIAMSHGATRRPVGATRLGLVLTMFGFGILGFAAIALRPAITARPEPKAGAPFITHGIYRFIRHPMYLGVFLIGLGITLNHWSVTSAVETLFLFLVLRFKYHYEDSLLRAKWPQAASYQAKIGAFLPKLNWQTRR
jgi:protein-S-isoprenylcysteine O-methyltransferase Ste14